MWKYALLGGAGGLAPAACQFLAMFLPNLFAGAEKSQRALASLPSTAELLFVDFIVLLAVFVIAAVVVYFTLDRQSEGAFTRAFLLGVSVPAMIVSWGNGGAPGDTKNKTAQMAWIESDQRPNNSAISLEELQSQPDRSPLQPAAFKTSNSNLISVAAATEAEPSQFRISVSCPDCPSGLQLTSLVNRVIVAGVPGSPMTIDASQGANLAGWNRLPVAKTISITIPDHEQAPPANSQVWRSATTHFAYREGDQWIINVTVRPGAFNNILAFFARPAYYVIESIAPTRTTSPKKSSAA